MDRNWSHGKSPWRRAVLCATMAALLPGTAALVAARFATAEPPEAGVEARDISLFNGKDLDGWDSDLGPAAKGAVPLGRNHDPKRVFSVVQADAEPAIRVSGEVWGGLSTRREFENYRIRLEFKWGERKWPPRQQAVRDSGLLYHCVGEPAPANGWMQSAECQIEEQDCGDFWSVRGVLADAQTMRMDATDDLRREFAVWCKRNEGNYPPFRYKKGGDPITVRGDGLMKSIDNEKPTGRWNVVEVYCLGTTSVHVVNGRANMVLTRLRLPAVEKDGKERPLRRGKLQLQSEGAEIFFRKISVRPISQIPREYLE